MRIERGAGRLLVLGAAAGVLAAGCASPVESPDAAPAPAPSTQSTADPMASVSPSAEPVVAPARVPPSPAPAADSALAVLAGLRVAGRGPITGYDRDEFGPAWADVDRNGCDTRNDILARDLTATTTKPGTRDCVVVAGMLADPFTATSIRFLRGGPSEVDIDHVVALGNAWVTGGARLPYSKRVAFANDPLNLLAVDSSANRQKRDGDAATWLPRNKAFRCEYVSIQIGVKAKYGLYVTPSEKQAMSTVLATCPGQPVAAGGGRVDSGFGPAPTRAATRAPARPATKAPAPGKKPKPKPKRPPASATTDPRFATCKAAKASGYGPYVQGSDPEYAWYRDADSDGIVCE